MLHTNLDQVQRQALEVMWQLGKVPVGSCHVEERREHNSSQTNSSATFFVTPRWLVSGTRCFETHHHVMYCTYVGVIYIVYTGFVFAFSNFLLIIFTQQTPVALVNPGQDIYKNRIRIWTLSNLVMVIGSACFIDT